MIDLGQCGVIAKTKPLPHELTGLITLFDTASGTPAHAYVYANASMMRPFPIINGNQIDIQPPANCFFDMHNKCCYSIVIVDADCNVLDVTQNDITVDTIKLCFTMPCSDKTEHEVKFLDPTRCNVDEDLGCLC